MAMVQIGADKKFFKFKSITPINHTFDLKLTDESFYNGKLWDLKQATREEKIQNKQIDDVFDCIKNRALYQKSLILEYLPSEPENFQQNYGFFK